MKKITPKFTFKKRRNFKMVTPCCNRLNSDGKFVSYNETSEQYGYCHSCGKPYLPKSLYEDDKGVKYTWNDILKKYEPLSLDFENIKLVKPQKTNITEQKFIPEKTIWDYYLRQPQNNLLTYLKNKYSSYDTEEVFKQYILGNTYDGGVVFWQINKKLKVQKGKVAYYDTNGRRTNKFNQPYTNEKGYFSCLFGEHLIVNNPDLKSKQKLILVESEKTAIVGAIVLKKYTWLSYCGRNGLTRSKYESLKGHDVIIIPDFSKKDIEIMSKKCLELKEIGVNACVLDITRGRNDNQLKNDNLYNCDLEDIIRGFKI